MLRINNEKKLWYIWNAHWWPILRCCYLVPDTILHWKNGRTDFGQTNIFFINKKHISKEGMACSKLIKISRLKMDNRAVRTLSKVNSSKYHLQLQFLVWHFQLEQDFQEFCDTTKIILHFFLQKCFMLICLSFEKTTKCWWGAFIFSTFVQSLLTHFGACFDLRSSNSHKRLCYESWMNEGGGWRSWE